MNLRSLTFPLLAIGGSIAASAATIDLSGVSLTTPPATAYAGGGVFYNGSDSAGGFTADGAFFANDYVPSWDSWSGWAYSTTSDTSTPGFGNQYSAFLPSPATRPYAVAFGTGARLTLPTGLDTPLAASVANTTYAALSMLNGDSFSKKFGGASGTDPDFFYVEFIGLNASLAEVARKRLYLADFRGASGDFILSDWTTVDLASLGSGIRHLELAFGSSDTGPWGINTPTYLALDSLTVIPEPSTLSALAGALALVIALRRKLSA